MRLRYFVLDVFTDRAFGGNPLAVVFGAEPLSGDTMQNIAREFNLSETVFVLEPRNRAATHRVRIFTPRVELPFAGHPTIGTAFLLATLSEWDPPERAPSFVLEEAVGNVPVQIQLSGREIVGAQMAVPRMPERGPEPPPAAELARMLSVPPDGLHPEIASQIWSCGVPFLFVALVDIPAVQKANLREPLWKDLLNGYAAQNIFVFAFGGLLPDAQIHARMFAPAFGIAEDPATGSAVSALAGCLGDSLPDGRYRWVVEQGLEMLRPSRLELECDRAGGRFQAVRVGGPAVVIAEGTLRVRATWP
jgi:trans-2,3-dihydro-3-hydroxyanthranilate isomerase